MSPVVFGSSGHAELAAAIAAAVVESVAAPIVLSCNVSAPGPLEAIVAKVGQHWGRLDFLYGR